MNWYIIRVILHNDKLGSAYTLLHKELAEIGFLPQVTSDTGNVVALPGGMYFGYSVFDAPTVRNIVQNVALQIDSDVFVLAMQVPSWASVGSVRPRAEFPLQALSLLTLGNP
jgi:hypothetical protein